jgi:hypothetical protein
LGKVAGCRLGKVSGFGFKVQSWEKLLGAGYRLLVRKKFKVQSEKRRASLKLQKICCEWETGCYPPEKNFSRRRYR